MENGFSQAGTFATAREVEKGKKHNEQSNCVLNPDYNYYGDWNSLEIKKVCFPEEGTLSYTIKL